MRQGPHQKKGKNERKSESLNPWDTHVFKVRLKVGNVSQTLSPKHMKKLLEIVFIFFIRSSPFLFLASFKLSC